MAGGTPPSSKRIPGILINERYDVSSPAVTVLFLSHR
jgi:hypothetical protein